MDRPPRQPPPSGIGVPILGQKKIADQITFELGPFKFHPPANLDQMYVMLMVMLSGASSSMYKTIAAFQQPGKPLAQVYLAEDCQLGKKHDLVMVTTSVNKDGEGQLGFVVAKPVEDDPSKKN